MVISVYTAPVVEPVTVDEAKLHLRVDSTDDDIVIETVIQEAREWIEESYSLALITQTLDYYLDEYPESDVMTLPVFPLQSVTSVTSISPAAAESVFASSNYAVDAVSQPGRIRLVSGASWPSDDLRVVNGVRVRYLAGYGVAGRTVPSHVRKAMLLLIGHLYENREATREKALMEVPFGVKALLNSIGMKGIQF